MSSVVVRRDEATGVTLQWHKGTDTTRGIYRVHDREGNQVGRGQFIIENAIVAYQGAVRRRRRKLREPQ